MKKIKISNVLKIVADALTKACIYFSVIIILFNIIGKFLGNSSFALNILGTLFVYDKFGVNFCFMLALASLLAGAAFQIFKVEKLPVISRHLAFFIFLYLDFLLVIIPFSNYSSSNKSMTLLLSVAFIVIYLVIFGIVMGIKAILNSVKNKKSNYEEQFKNVK